MLYKGRQQWLAADGVRANNYKSLLVGVIGGVDIKWKGGYTFGMKTAISIPDNVFRSADTMAKRLGVSRSQLYSKAMEEFLARHRSRQVTARLDDLYSEAESSISPEITKAQVKTILHEEW